MPGPAGVDPAMLGPPRPAWPSLSRGFLKSVGKQHTSRSGYEVGYEYRHNSLDSCR